jgi:hypothetical protein
VRSRPTGGIRAPTPGCWPRPCGRHCTASPDCGCGAAWRVRVSRLLPLAVTLEAYFGSPAPGIPLNDEDEPQRLRTGAGSPSSPTRRA